MQLNDVEKRWLEINFYFLCKKIYSTSENYQDIENFFKAFSWTNLYDCDKLIKTFNDTNILINPTIIPSKREFLVCLDQPTKLCRFQYKKEALDELAKPLGYRYFAKAIYVERMRQEVDTVKITLFPKIEIKSFHEAYYSFLLTLSYFSDLFSKKIRL